MTAPRWLHMLSADVAMAPGFVAAMDRQLRAQAQASAGVDLASGYTLLPPDGGFAVQFRPTGPITIGVIEGDLVDPSAFGHPVALAWRATDAPNQPIGPDQERGDLEFFWMQFPIAELSAGTQLDTRDMAAAVTARFPVDWEVHEWSSVWLALHGQRAFTDDETTELARTAGDAMRAWNDRGGAKIQYVSEPTLDAARTEWTCYLDLGANEGDAVVEVINQIGASSAAAAIARGYVGRKR